MKKEYRRKEIISNVHWLPNLLTTASIFSAFYSIMAAIEGFFEVACLAIFIAMIFDTLDGRVARLTKSASSFGAQYDSLADVVSFGVAPAALCYIWALKDFGRFGWLVSFTYLACTALRLARFNAKVNITDKKFFQGLPCPSAAAVVTSLVWTSCKYGFVDMMIIKLCLLFICMGVAGLMVSNVGYYSFKDIDLKGRSPYMIGFLNTLVLIAVFIDPPVMLFTVFFIYSLSGLIFTLHKKKILKKKRRLNKHAK